MENYVAKCPFCGEMVILEKPKSDVSNTFVSPYVKEKESQKVKIECRKCRSQGPLASNKEEALEVWNKRNNAEKAACPFCGEKNFGTKKCLCNGHYSIVCNNCSASGPRGENGKEASEKWENRHDTV